MLCFFTAKGGSGCTVTAAAVALLAARHGETLLVDLAGDLGLALGALSSESGPPGADPGLPAGGWGVAGWLQAPHPPPDALIRMERPLQPGLSLLPFGSGPPGSSLTDDGPARSAPPPGREPPVPARSRATVGSEPDEPVADAEWVEPTVERLKILASLLAGESRRVVVDLGFGPGFGPGLGSGALGGWGWQAPFLDQSTCSLLVTRACYLGLTRASRLRRPDGVVLIEEPGRALRPADVAASLGVPVVASVPADPAVARAVDAGLLARRLPRALDTLQAVAEQGAERW